MNLILLTEKDRVGDELYRLADHRAEHVRSVLRSEAGDRVEAGLINGPQGTALLETIDAGQVLLRIESWKPVPMAPPVIDLICALPRPQTLKKVLITVGMMGVRRLHLIRANRVEKSYYQSPLLQADRYTPYLIEGMAQGKLTRLPEVNVHERFRRFFEDDLPALEEKEDTPALRLLADIESESPLSDAFDGRAERLLVAIGPEGGWVPFETELTEEIGFRPFSLGRWVLRVENAVNSLLSQIELVRMMRQQAD